MKNVQNEKGLSIIVIRSNHGGEFENANFQEICESFEIKHKFSTSRTPLQSGVVERKNRVLQEMARTMLNFNSSHNVFGQKPLTQLVI